MTQDNCVKIAEDFKNCSLIFVAESDFTIFFSNIAHKLTIKKFFKTLKGSSVAVGDHSWDKNCIVWFWALILESLLYSHTTIVFVWPNAVIAVAASKATLWVSAY